MIKFKKFLVKYLICILLPWWTLNPIFHKWFVKDRRYKIRVRSFWIFKYTIGWVLPWWVCSILSYTTRKVTFGVISDGGGGGGEVWIEESFEEIPEEQS
jgi:uncharacterized membrane protein YwzB